MPPERSDLNLFRVFDAVMRHGKLTAAGRELGISASAVSHALARLRTMLGTELFVTKGRGIVPTTQAAVLAPRIAAGLAELDDVVAARSFDPANSDRVLCVGFSDYIGTIVLPGLVAQVVAKAPRLRLRVFPIGRTDMVEHLDEGRLDLILGWLGPTPERVQRRSAFADREALLVRRGHPLAGTVPDRKALLAFRYVVVELVGSGEPATDGFFDERGLNRRVRIERLLLESVGRDTMERLTAFTVPNYNLVPSLLRATELVATVPLRLAQQIAASGEFTILPLPYEPREVLSEMAWHERSDRDPALLWLVGEIALTCAGLDDLPFVESGSGQP